MAAGDKLKGIREAKMEILVDLLRWAEVHVAKQGDVPTPHLKTPIMVGGVTKDVVWEGIGAEVTYTGLKVSPGARFLAFLAMHPVVVANPGTRGKLFVAYVDDGKGRREIGRRLLDPNARAADARWVSIVMPLGVSRVSTITLTLAVLPGPDGGTFGDWCLWGEPTILTK